MGQARPVRCRRPSATTGGTGQIEIRQVSEMSDFPPELFASDEGSPESHVPSDSAEGAAPPPEMAPPVIDPKKLQYMMMFKADKNTEAGILPDKKVFEEMGIAMGELAASGSLDRRRGASAQFQGAAFTSRRGNAPWSTAPSPRRRN